MASTHFVTYVKVVYDGIEYNCLLSDPEQNCHVTNMELLDGMSCKSTTDNFVMN